MIGLSLPPLLPLNVEEVRRHIGRLDVPEPEPAMMAALEHAWRYSPFLRGLMRQRTEAVTDLLTHGPDAAFDRVLARLASDEPASIRMRHAKADAALVVALADLAELWSLDTVTGALSTLADRTLDLAVATAIAERVPDAAPGGFAVLALGKLGGRELNYSSDVDLIFLHDRTRLPKRERDDPDEAALRIARRVVELMQAREASGYVFRVDLRLRPSPEATPITLPVGAAESYYQSEALPWERAAFIRARACAGDIELGESFLTSIQPFIWRRSLDYSAIRDIQAISLRIRDHYDEGQAPGPGFDLKRGRGGIREIEFYAQIHQMIFGGREPALRSPVTVAALQSLAQAGRIGDAEADTLAEAYRFLRTVEHRVQMQADEQTHLIPKAAAARTALAQVCGLDGWRSLERLLLKATRAVAKQYDTLVERAGGKQLPRDAQALARQLTRRKLPDPADVATLIGKWRSGGYRALRSADAQRLLESLLPRLVEAFAALPDPKAAFARLDGFLEQLPAGVQFLSLLDANPPLVGLLGRLLGVTPVLADALARTPDLFDVLLDPQAFEPLPDVAALTTELRSFASHGHIEDRLDRVRRWTAERRFQIGAQLIEGLSDPIDAASAYAALADAAIAVLAPEIADAFAEAHGRVPGAELVVLGLGRYGGRALTVRSDLDLVYLFTGDHEAQSDGLKPLAATPYFNRLAQRLTAALSVPTAAGALYEIDTRLRPSGAQGLLAVTVDSFARYQQEEAWTWEHMALTRARVVHGSSAARERVEAVMAEVLSRPRDPAKLREDVLTMRDEMEAHKPGAGLWDVKLGRGGLVDLEFIVHFRQLRDHMALTPDLRAACEALGEPPLVAAHNLLTRLLVLLRLVVPHTSGQVGKLPSHVQALLARVTGHPDFAAVEASLKLAKATVLEAWEATFGIKRRGK